MKKYIHYIAIIGLLSVMVVPVQAAASASAVLAEAKQLFKKADKMQGAWVTTDKLIKKAEAAMKKGDKKAALKLATKAKQEAQLSITQAEEQLKNWSEPSYIRQ
ncbi:MAG: hypothetical protein OEY00_12750 [Gammaproteobacteria bacterium]|nr:hypothetical protein [Gammaproteobacteria bacterium]